MARKAGALWDLFCRFRGLHPVCVSFGVLMIPQVMRQQKPLNVVPCPQYSLSSKRSSPDDGNDVSPYSLSPVSNKR